MTKLKIGRKSIFATVAVVLLSSAVGAAAWHQIAQNDGRGESSATNLPASAALPVKIFEVSAAGSTSTDTQLTGTVRARYETQIAFRVAGKLLTREVEVGAYVQHGQLLFTLDPLDYQLQLKSAEANLEVARAAVTQAVAEEKRLLELRRSNAVSASEYERGLSDRDIAVGRRESAQKQLELAQNQLDYCQLRADTDGIVTAISAEAGQVVAAGGVVCTIARRQPLEAVIDIPENRLPKDSKLVTTVRFWSLPGIQCQAQLRELSPTADPLTRTYRGRFTLIDPPSSVQLGMTATVNLNDARSMQEFAIPATAIFQQASKPAVWLVSDTGSLKAQPVMIERLGSDRVIVSEGLSAGQRIVAAAVYKLDASQRVRAWEISK